MGAKHERLYKAAVKASDELMDDRSVSIGETRRGLNALRDHIDIMIDSLGDEDLTDIEESDA